MKPVVFAVTLATCAGLTGCKENADASAATPNSAPAPAPAPVPSAAPPAAERRCPPESSGKGTYGAPCKASGTTRLVALKFVKHESPYVTFTATHSGPYRLIGGRRSLRAYDATGKQLEFRIGGGPMAYLATNEAVTPIEAGKTGEVKFHLSEPPKGATRFEAEFDTVEMATSGTTPDFLWKNSDLARPEGPPS